MFFNKSNLRGVGFLLWRFLVRVDLVRRNDSVVCRCNCHVPRQNNACKMKNKILCTLFNFHISKKKNMLCDEWGKVINSKWHRLCTSASAKLAKIVAIPKNHFLYSIVHKVHNLFTTTFQIQDFPFEFKMIGNLGKSGN